MQIDGNKIFIGSDFRTGTVQVAIYRPGEVTGIVKELEPDDALMFAERMKQRATEMKEITKGESK